jgi:hypothetical protein
VVEQRCWDAEVGSESSEIESRLAGLSFVSAAGAGPRRVVGYVRPRDGTGHRW